MTPAMISALRTRFETDYSAAVGSTSVGFLAIYSFGKYANTLVQAAWEVYLSLAETHQRQEDERQAREKTEHQFPQKFYPRDKNTGMSDDQAASLDVFEREYQRSFGASATLFVRNRVVGEEVYHSAYAVHAYRGWLAALAYAPCGSPPQEPDKTAVRRDFEADFSLSYAGIKNRQDLFARTENDNAYTDLVVQAAFTAYRKVWQEADPHRKKPELEGTYLLPAPAIDAAMQAGLHGTSDASVPPASALFTRVEMHHYGASGLIEAEARMLLTHKDAAHLRDTLHTGVPARIFRGEKRPQ